MFKNIVELVSCIDSLALYPLDNTVDIELFNGGGAILRCKTCFVLHKDKAIKLTPTRAAHKLSHQCNSVCTGRYLDEDKMSQVMSGKGNYWRKLTSSVLQHMICATDGQTHFKALKMINEESNLKKKYYEAATLCLNAQSHLLSQSLLHLPIVLVLKLVNVAIRGNSSRIL